MTENEFNGLEEVGEDLLLLVLKTLGAEDWEEENNPFNVNLSFKYGDVQIGFKYIGDDGWDAEGKYQYATEKYQLVNFDNTEYKYACEKNITQNYNLFFDVPVSRAGSYYSGYYYLYYYPKIFKAKIKQIPEVIIPAHNEINFEEVKDI